MKSDTQIKAEQALQLASLLDWVGSRKRLAKACGVTSQAVYEWVKRGRISASAAIIVERETAGLFTKENLRPDVTDWEQGEC